jgi:hypothetical protein
MGLASYPTSVRGDLLMDLGLFHSVPDENDQAMGHWARAPIVLCWSEATDPD